MGIHDFAHTGTRSNGLQHLMKIDEIHVFAATNATFWIIKNLDGVFLYFVATLSHIFVLISNLSVLKNK